MAFAKVTYRMKDSDRTSQAYIDDETGKGTNKHTEFPVDLIWEDSLEQWIDVSDKTYLELPNGEIVELPLLDFPQNSEFQRVQPKRLTRKQRKREV